VEKWEKVILLLLPLAAKHWNLSRATKHWNLPLATELRSSFASFLFLLFKRANLDHLGFSFFEDNFLIKFREYLLPQPFIIGKK
jgi:hypothetical protein